MDEYREQQRARWASIRGGQPAPKQAPPSALPSSTVPKKRVASADADDEIIVLDDDYDHVDDDEALARRLQAEEEGKGASAPTADEDVELARLLQEEEERHMQSLSNPGKGATETDLLEPTPDIYTLFRNFNELYFQKKLEMVEVKWGPRMTLCAGLCSYEGKGGACVIKLSEPLLKYRTTKDLIDTLLHEMIHAYLFVAANKRDHEDHGPLFLEKMNEINRIAGTHITVYHSFRDEVNLYRVHWWKCDGKCGNIIKRAMNRAPGTYDRWFGEHQHKCGGKFIKIKEPEKKDKDKAKGGKRAKKGADEPAAAAAPAAKPAAGRAPDVSLDRWVRKGPTAPTPAPPRASPPPPPLERRTSGPLKRRDSDVILIDSGESPAPKKEEAADSDEDFRLLDRRGSLIRNL